MTVLRSLIAGLTACALLLGPALADGGPQNGGVSSVQGKFGPVKLAPGDVGALPCSGTCAQWTSFLPALMALVSAASAIDIETGIVDAPAGADYVELRSGTITAGKALATFIQARYSLTSTQMAGLFQTAGATTTALIPFSAAAVDLSNVPAAAGRASLGLGTFASLSSLTGLDATGATVQVAGTSAPLRTGDIFSRGLFVTPQMLGARCNSNGTSGNGADDTAAIQAAETLAEQSGAVFLIPGQPAGHMCRTTAPIKPTGHIVIDGAYCLPYDPRVNTQPSNTPGPGSWLFFDHTGPGIFVTGSNPTAGIVLQNFCTYRPQPPYVTTGTWAPNESMDYDLSIGADDTLIQHVMLLNPTKAIYITGRATIKDVRGSPYVNGITVGPNYDILRVEDIHFWPFATINQPAENYKMTHLEALNLTRSDNPMISNFFAIGAKTCVHLSSSTYGIVSKAKFANLDCDLFGSYGILVDGDGTTAQVSNYTAQGMDGTGGVNAINIAANNVHITVDNVRPTNIGADAIVASGGGTWLVLNGLMAENWGITTTGCAVSANNGATVTIGPGQLFAPYGAHGTCQYGGNGTVQATSLSKVN